MFPDAVQPSSSPKVVNADFMKRTTADLEAAEALILLSRSPSPAETKPQVSELDPIARVMMGGSASLIEHKKKSSEELAIEAEIMKEINEALGETSDNEEDVTVETTPMVTENLEKPSKTSHEAVSPSAMVSESIAEVAVPAQETSLEISMERKELEAYLISSPPAKTVETVQLPEVTTVEEKLEVPPPHSSKIAEKAKQIPETTAVVNVEAKMEQESKHEQVGIASLKSSHHSYLEFHQKYFRIINYLSHFRSKCCWSTMTECQLVKQRKRRTKSQSRIGLVSALFDITISEIYSNSSKKWF